MCSGMQVIQMFDKAESEYKELSGRKQIVLNDRHKIEQVTWGCCPVHSKSRVSLQRRRACRGKTRVCAAARGQAAARPIEQRPVPVQQCRCLSSLPQSGSLLVVQHFARYGSLSQQVNTGLNAHQLQGYQVGMTNLSNCLHPVGHC